MAMKMPRISQCEVESCSYNSKKACHAMAITVGDGNKHPLCDTMVEAGHKGGASASGQVGACKEEDCRYNEALECTAKSIAVEGHEGCADCATYSAR